MDTYEKQGEYRRFLPLLYLPVSGNQQVKFVSQGHTQSLDWMLSWCFCGDIYSDCKWQLSWVTTAYSEAVIWAAFIRAVFFSYALFSIYQHCIFCAILLPSQLIMRDSCVIFSGRFWFWLLETALYHLQLWLSTIFFQPMCVCVGQCRTCPDLPCLPFWKFL